MNQDILNLLSGRATVDPIRFAVGKDEQDKGTQSIFTWLRLAKRQVLKRSKGLQRSLAAMQAEIQQQGQGFQQCIKIVEQCRLQTEDIRAQTLERHALEPAIVAVVSLVDEVQRLRDLSRVLLQEYGPNHAIKTLANEAKISHLVAQQSLAGLGIKRIIPKVNGEFDYQLCQVRAAQDTEDKALHSKICEVIKPGLQYRNKILQPAQVIVWRCCQTGLEATSDQERSQK